MEITLLSTVVGRIVVCREVRSVGLSVFNSPVFVTQKFIYINSYFCRLFFYFDHILIYLACLLSTATSFSQF